MQVRVNFIDQVNKYLRCRIITCHSNRITPSVFASTNNCNMTAVIFNRGVFLIDNVNQITGFTCFSPTDIAICDALLADWANTGFNYVPIRTAFVDLPNVRGPEKYYFAAFIMEQALNRNLTYFAVTMELYRQPEAKLPGFFSKKTDPLQSIRPARQEECDAFLAYNELHREAWDAHFWEPQLNIGIFDFSELQYSYIILMLKEIMDSVCTGEFCLYRRMIGELANMDTEEFAKNVRPYTKKLIPPLVTITHNFVKCAAAVADDISSIPNGLLRTILEQPTIEPSPDFLRSPNILLQPLPFPLFREMYFYAMREDNLVTNMLRQCN